MLATGGCPIGTLEKVCQYQTCNEFPTIMQASEYVEYHRSPLVDQEIF